MSVLLVYLEKFLLRYRHYKTSLLLLIISPIFFLLHSYLLGKFVKTTVYYNKVVKYLYFIIFSMVVAHLFTEGWRTILRNFYSSNTLYEGLLKGVFRIISYKVLLAIIQAYLDDIVLILVVLLFFSANLDRLIVSLALSLSLIIFAVSLAFLISPLFLYFRGTEIRTLEFYMHTFSELLVPINFSLFFLPNYNLIATVFPSIGLMEEIRKYLFLGEMNTSLFLQSFMVSIVYLVVGIAVFGKALNFARKKGWMGLK